MKVKINNTIFDSSIEPIMLILSDDDLINISNMPSYCTKYCSFPEKIAEQDIKDFMEEE